jgi:hypothetical protein
MTDYRDAAGGEKGNAPMPKFLGLRSKRGFLGCLVALPDLPTAPGGFAGFFPDFFGG